MVSLPIINGSRVPGCSLFTKPPADFAERSLINRVNRAVGQRAGIEQQIGFLRFRVRQHLHHVVGGLVLAFGRLLVAPRGRLQRVADLDRLAAVLLPDRDSRVAAPLEGRRLAFGAVKSSSPLAPCLNEIRQPGWSERIRP